MTADPNFARTAALIGDPTRAAMLAALLGGSALTASELAHGAGVSPQTASTHLARLLDGGLVRVVAAGRHRYYQLATPDVARVLESLATIAAPAPIRSLRQSENARALRFARTCYDHLAGTVGVALTERLVESEIIAHVGDTYHVTQTGVAWLAQRGIDGARVFNGRRAAARACLDWSERRHHVAGAFGAVLTDWLLAEGWFSRVQNDRALRLTDAGRAGFAREWNLRFDLQ
ncbi:MAG TPA: winged helix-turn-helix domain-containing protein [Roseiflexaceae bacterium]|jgi:DNA-binding transcriptional ArsR family regulator|nr:winged helix-turn-helix domain-containing protein [Roseiflexaceae bacterium]